MPKSKYRQPRNIQARDRFISRMTDTERELASYKIRNPQEQELTPYLRALNQVLWNTDDINKHHIVPVIPSRRLPQAAMSWHEQIRQTYPPRPEPVKYHFNLDNVLDAPDMLNDFYSSNLALSTTMMYTVLGNVAYSYNLTNNYISSLFNIPQADRINAVKNHEDRNLSIVTEPGKLLIYDLSSNRFSYTKRFENTGGIKSVEPFNRPTQLFLGSGHGYTAAIDTRAPNPMTFLIDNTDGQMNDMVCGLSYQANTRLLACGMNNNKALIWDVRQTARPLQMMTKHQAAIKAIQFHPSRSNLLVSGGGTEDQTVRIWNASTGREYTSLKVGGQVNGVMWSNQHKGGLLTAHDNQLSYLHFFDRENRLCHKASANEHQERVVSAAQTPDGQKIITLGADETLRFFSTSVTGRKRAKDLSKPVFDSFHLQIR